MNIFEQMLIKNWLKNKDNLIKNPFVKERLIGNSSDMANGNNNGGDHIVGKK